MMESATKTIRASAVRYAGVYLALAVLSVGAGRQYALSHNYEGASAAQPGASLGSVQLIASGGTPGKPDNGQGAQQPFTMSGSVTGLKLGSASHIPVLVANPNKQALTIQTVTVAVADASPTCAAANLTVGSYNASTPGALVYNVPGNGTVTIPIRVELLNGSANQDACKGKTFPLSFDGTAVQTGGAK
jgi:hypothetical protein